MLTKLLTNICLLIILCKTLSNCETKSDSEPNIKELIKGLKQRPSAQNQWPSAKWNESQWPSTNWRPSSPGSADIGKVVTKYPPLPNYTWPSMPARPISLRPTKATTIPTETDPVETEPSETNPITTTTQKAPTTTKRVTPQRTKPTVAVTVPTVPDEDPSKITVKSCGMSHIPHEFNGNKIVSGKIAKGGEFPWQVILKINTAKGNMQCGGAILNSRWVLTAAHCVSNERDGQPTANRIDLTAGVHNRLQMSAGSQQRTADCVIQHESWRGQNGNFKNDIALLRMPTSNPFELTYEKGGHVNGICLPQNPMSEYSGKARIAGWGLTKDRGTPSDVLLYTDVSIITNDKCRQYQYPVPIADSMICQGVDRTAPCQGDSGGCLIIPISDSRGVQRMTEVGVVSFGPGQCANAKTPNAIYTKVSHFLKWIEKNIQANAQKCVSRPLRTSPVEKIGEILENETNSTLSAENFIF